jgi:hypothetical protein
LSVFNNGGKVKGGQKMQDHYIIKRALIIVDQALKESKDFDKNDPVYTITDCRMALINVKTLLKMIK